MNNLSAFKISDFPGICIPLVSYICKVLDDVNFWKQMIFFNRQTGILLPKQNAQYTSKET